MTSQRISPEPSISSKRILQFTFPQINIILRAYIDGI